MPLSQRKLHQPPSRLFKAYTARLVYRAVLFAFVVAAFISDPKKLEISEYFGFAHGFNLVDLLFISLLIDMITKFLPKANISMGSLKQFGDYQIPTFAIFRGGREGFQQFISDSMASGKNAINFAKERGLNALIEVREGAVGTMRTLLRDVTFLRSLTYFEEDLTAGEELRNEIRADRLREIVPVTVFWFVFNALIGVTLFLNGLLNQRVIALWCAFYFLSDMICVVFWCPIQVFLMKNRCCTTCQIFNWDAIMAATPLLPLFFVTPFSTILVLIALVVLVRWELAFVRHPERFDERTNMSLRCANCADKLCYFRDPLTHVVVDKVTRQH